MQSWMLTATSSGCRELSRWWVLPAVTWDTPLLQARALGAGPLEGTCHFVGSGETLPGCPIQCGLSVWSRSRSELLLSAEPGTRTVPYPCTALGGPLGTVQIPNCPCPGLGWKQKKQLLRDHFLGELHSEISF